MPEQLAPPLLRWGVPISLVGLLLNGGLRSGNLQAALFSLVLVGCGLLLDGQRPQPRQVLNTPVVRAVLVAALWWPARLVLWLMLWLALPAAALLSCLALVRPAPLRDALVLQAAARTAMSVLLRAEASQQKGREAIPAAELVLWSPLLALLSVPLWWWLLNQPLLQPCLQATVAM
jgi:predicted permease